MKKTQKHYWKLVHINENNPTVFTSCVVRYGKYSLMYKIGKQTKSAMTENGIFVFNTRKNARKFRKGFVVGSDYKIFKCMVRGEETVHPTYYSTFSLKSLSQKEVVCRDFPPGTRSFPAITLIKQSR